MDIVTVIVGIVLVIVVVFLRIDYVVCDVTIPDATFDVNDGRPEDDVVLDGLPVARIVVGERLSIALLIRYKSG